MSSSDLSSSDNARKMIYLPIYLSIQIEINEILLVPGKVRLGVGGEKEIYKIQLKFDSFF